MRPIAGAVRVVVFPEGNYLVAQCLEHNVAAQGANIEELKEAFERTFIGMIVLAIQHGQKPFENIGKAPRQFWRMWEHGERLREPLAVKLPRTFRNPTHAHFPKQAQLALA